MSPQKYNVQKSLGVLLTMLLLSAAAFALIQGLFILFCTQVLNFSDHKSYVLYASYTSLIFASPVLGGYLAGRLIGYIQASIVGHILAISGIYILCFCTSAHLYIGLAFYISGMAALGPALWVLFGNLIHDQHRDSKFTLGYTCINLGAFIALASSGFIIDRFGYHNAFFLAATILLIAFFIFILNIRSFSLIDQQEKSSFQIVFGILLLLLLIPITAYLLYNAEISGHILYCSALIAFLFILLLTRNIKNKQKRQLILFLVISAIGVAFWSLYVLEPSLLTLFVQRNVDRHLMGINIPAPEFLSLNPLFIIVMGGIFSALWISLQKIGKSPSLPSKFALGIGLLGIAYLLLSVATHFPESNGRISMSWVIIVYSLFAAAELCIAPIGTAMVGLLVPKALEGAMMGIWQLSIGLGCVIAGYLAQTTISKHDIISAHLTDSHYAFSFYHFGIIALLIAIIALLVNQVKTH